VPDQEVVDERIGDFDRAMAQALPFRERLAIFIVRNQHPLLRA